MGTIFNGFWGIYSGKENGFLSEFPFFTQLLIYEFVEEGLWVAVKEIQNLHSSSIHNPELQSTFSERPLDLLLSLPSPPLSMFLPIIFHFCSFPVCFLLFYVSD